MTLTKQEQPVDEEAVELFLLDCLYPKEGQKAVEEFLQRTSHVLPVNIHSRVADGVRDFLASVADRKSKAAANEQASEAPREKVQAGVLRSVTEDSGRQQDKPSVSSEAHQETA
eukprot:CAMPEP_0181342794 /NCGR_PEP_ID=MMETSP1101-20121128/31208_1 /TAXON_ID=46948 /ORGANISM="Rhodomonas abbreviata, Strain Caron Lab Isolate" /LENGTH=113 /DNA_ID=CAMNT_0023454311 /DNA_START=21 /DNA_END=358 /DNA_ORIENTATION=-